MAFNLQAAVLLLAVISSPILEGKLECGIPTVYPKKKSDKQMYIFDGEDVPLGMFPWIGYLVYGDKAKYAECTVTLVKPKWLITAAHCVTGECAKDAWVVLGTVKRENVRNHNIYKVSKLLHPKSTKYVKNRQVPIDDIAVIKLEKDVDISAMNGTINTICLPKPEQELTGTMYLSGWGLTAEDSLNPADSLKYIEANVLANATCFDDTSKFCVQGVKDGQTPYRGDSGGPAMMLVDKKYYLHGALSGGNKTIALYSTVKNFLKWIVALKEEDTVSLDTCNKDNNKD